MEVVSLGEEVAAEGSWRVEVGSREEEVEMGTRKMVHSAEGVLVGQQMSKQRIRQIQMILWHPLGWMSVPGYLGCPSLPRPFPPLLGNPTGRHWSGRSHRNTACAL